MKKIIKNTEIWKDIKYELIKSRRRSMALEVNEKAQLVVRVPFRVGGAEIRSLLHKNNDWIIQKMSVAKRKVQDIKHQQFFEGEDIIFLGKEYLLHLQKEKIIRGLCFSNNEFFLNSDDVDMGAVYLEKWYKEQAKHICSELAHDLSKQMGVVFKKIKINGPKHRWGSCSRSGNINISFRIMMAPLSIIKYVVVHELSHLIYMNHSKSFWRNVEKYSPDYKLSSQWLKKNGHTLTIL